MRVGSWDVKIVSAGRFRLDGGAMFGTVPKVVWSRLMPADAQNRIEMACNCLLLRGEVEGRPRVVLVDSGNGDTMDATIRARLDVREDGVLARELAAAGVAPEAVRPPTTYTLPPQWTTPGEVMASGRAGNGVTRRESPS